MTRGKKISSGQGWALIQACPKCGRSPSQCLCDDHTDTSHAGPKVAKLRMEKRKGKPVTIIFDLNGVVSLKDLGRQLKNLVSAGGTAKMDTIEIQGEHRERVRAYLIEQGFQVKG